MIKLTKRVSAPALLALLVAAPAQAAVKPHGLFTDGAVLQRDIRVPIWGTADGNERVTVEIAGQKVATEATDGKWMVWLKSMPAGGPHTLTISSPANEVEVKNVLIGEVWICSGQSNMAWPLINTENSQQEIAASADRQLRLLTIQRATSRTEVHEVTAPWVESTPQSTERFSAVAYYFGKELRKKLGVPVGLINTSWGGTVAEAWTSPDALIAQASLAPILDNYRTARKNYAAALINYQQALSNHALAVEQARRQGRMPPAAPRPPGDPYSPNNPNRPSVLYNAMIAPLVPYAFRGAIWYQGESNAGRAYEYQTLFPTMIGSWRDAWGQGDFPFLFVQLAPFMAIQPEPGDSAWAELREAQRLTTIRVPNTGMAVITDVGEERDIHPRKKEPVGQRLAFAALQDVYDQDMEGSGPTFHRLRISGDRAILTFKHVGGGLVAQGGKLTGFTIAGEDRKFHNADAVIEGDRVIVTSPQVKKPVAVRFGWANYPVVNLFNKEGIPASPFRTDDFPFTTQPK
jgi:sialate O-acetylesterase